MKQNNDGNVQLQISKKQLKGDDSHKVFSIRVRESTVAKLDQVALESNRSRNELINLLLDFALEHCTIVE